MAGVMIVNPPEDNPRRGRKKSKRRSGTKRAKSRTRRRSNPGQFRATSHRRPKRRRARRNNPGAMRLGGLKVFGVHLGVKDIGWGIVGAVAVETGAAALDKVDKLPEQLKTGVGALFLKGVLVIVAGAIAKPLLGTRAAAGIVVGGGIAVGVDAVRAYVLPHIPGLHDTDELESPATLAGYRNTAGAAVGASGRTWGPAWSER